MNTQKLHEWISGITDWVYAKTGVYDQKNYFNADFISFTPEPVLCFIFRPASPIAFCPT